MKMTVASEFMHRLMLIAALSMTGCTPVGPDYVAPTVTTPAVWNAKLEAGLAGTDPGVEALARWWSKLQEPVLLELIDRAVISNRDLQQAQARVREARARGGISAAERFPTVNVGGAATRNQTSDESGFGTTRELYSVGVDARWEIDLFGGKRRALEAASASIEASEDDLRDVLVSLIGDVALSYVDLRTFQTRWSIAASNLAAQSETFDIARWRYEAGLTTARDVEQARLNLEQTRAQMPTLRTGIEQAGRAAVGGADRANRRCNGRALSEFFAGRVDRTGGVDTRTADHRECSHDGDRWQCGLAAVRCRAHPAEHRGADRASGAGARSL